MEGLKKFGQRARALWHDRRGITGLETAIVLIAFVVVAAVFAFAVLSTGLLSSEQAKETVLGGLSETAASIALRGSVIGHDTGVDGDVDVVVFQVSNASQTGEGVNLASSGTESAIISYIDNNQAVNLSSSSWLATWLVGSGNLLDAGERVEIRVTLTGLSTLLGTSTQFKIEVKPTKGAVLIVERTTPAELKLVNDFG